MGPGNQQETDENPMSPPEQFVKEKAKMLCICNTEWDIREQEVVKIRGGSVSGHQFSFSTTKTLVQGKTTIYGDSTTFYMFCSQISVCIVTHRYGNGSLVWHFLKSQIPASKRLFPLMLKQNIRECQRSTRLQMWRFESWSSAALNRKHEEVHSIWSINPPGRRVFEFTFSVVGILRRISLKQAQQSTWANSKPCTLEIWYLQTCLR